MSKYLLALALFSHTAAWGAVWIPVTLPGESHDISASPWTATGEGVTFSMQGAAGTIGSSGVSGNSAGTLSLTFSSPNPVAFGLQFTYTVSGLESGTIGATAAYAVIGNFFSGGTEISTSPVFLSATYNSTTTAQGSFYFLGGSSFDSTTLTFDGTSPGGSTFTATGWSLAITPVPEPVNVALGLFGGALIGGTLVRRIVTKLRQRHENGPLPCTAASGEIQS